MADKNADSINLLEHQCFNEAIGQYVFRHSEVVAHHNAVVEANERCRHIFRGYYWSIGDIRQAIWPVCYDVETHLWQYQTPPIEWHMGRSYHLTHVGGDFGNVYGVYEDGNPLPEVRQAFEALAMRLNEFLNFFRSGALVAWGQNGQDRALRSVDNRLWSQPHFFFRLSNSGASFEEFRNGEYLPLFLTLQVHPRGWSPDKKKPGSKAKFDWYAAKQEFDRLCLMPEYQDKHQAALVDLVHDWFGANFEKIPTYGTVKKYVRRWMEETN
jgi:hypothetical protein